MRAPRATGRADGVIHEGMMRRGLGAGPPTCAATWTYARAAWGERGSRQRRAMYRGRTGLGASAGMAYVLGGCVRGKRRGVAV